MFEQTVLETQHYTDRLFRFHDPTFGLPVPLG